MDGWSGPKIPRAARSAQASARGKAGNTMPNVSPLNSEEAEVAVRLAGDSEQVRELVGERASVVLAEPAVKERRQPDEARYAVVGFYSYEKGQSVVAVVDLNTQQVDAVEAVPVQFQLSQQEKQQAEELAADDQRVRDFLGDRDMNPLTRLFFPATAAKDAPPHRYAVVFLRPSVNERRFAVVDLTDRQVVDVVSPEAFTGQ
jgi:hypothetical protein